MFFGKREQRDWQVVTVANSEGGEKARSTAKSRARKRAGQKIAWNRGTLGLNRKFTEKGMDCRAKAKARNFRITSALPIHRQT